MSDRGMPSRFAPDVSPPAELFSRVRTAVAATPVSKTPMRVRIAVALALTPLVTAGVLGIASQVVYQRPTLRVAMGTRPTFEFFLVLLFMIGLTLSATLVAFRRGELGLGSGALALSLVALLVAPIYATFTVMIPLETSADAVAALAALSPWGLRCLAIAAAVGVLVLVAFTAALRHSAPVAVRLRGGALGAAAGAWAGLAVFVFCPATEVPHLLVGHVLPIAAFTLLGLAATPRMLRP